MRERGVTVLCFWRTLNNEIVNPTDLISTVEWRNNLLERVGQTGKKNRQLLMQLNWRDVSFHEIRLYGRITKPYTTSKVTFPSEKKKRFALVSVLSSPIRDLTT
jgi:hypothetical protein